MDRLVDLIREHRKWVDAPAPGQSLDVGFIAALGNPAATLQNLTIEANGKTSAP